jgi:hypothetical protein
MFLRECLNPKTGQIVYQFAGRLGWRFYERARDGGHIPITIEDGRTYIEDTGDMRVQMRHWIGLAHRGALNGPSGPDMTAVQSRDIVAANIPSDC